MQIVAVDAPPTPRRAPAEERSRRRTVLEEYEEDVEVLGPDGRTFSGVSVPRAATLALAGHATSAACFERRLARMNLTLDAEASAVALGDAAMAAQDAARVFAAAGEVDVARGYDHRLAGHRAKAAVPLERVRAVLRGPYSRQDVRSSTAWRCRRRARCARLARCARASTRSPARCPRRSPERARAPDSHRTPWTSARQSACAISRRAAGAPCGGRRRVGGPPESPPPSRGPWRRAWRRIDRRFTTLGNPP